MVATGRLHAQGIKWCFVRQAPEIEPGEHAVHAAGPCDGQARCRALLRSQVPVEVEHLDGRAFGEQRVGRRVFDPESHVEGLAVPVIPGGEGRKVGSCLVERVLDDLDGQGVLGSRLHTFARPEKVLSGPDVQDPPVRGQLRQCSAEALVAFVVGGHGRVEERVVDGVLPHARPQGGTSLLLGFGVHAHAQGSPMCFDLLDVAHDLPFAVVLLAPAGAVGSGLW
jgi:hypothetical protein